MAGHSRPARRRVGALTAIGLLASHLTADNHRDVLAAARHKTKRQVEEIVAWLRPQPPTPSSVRKLPVPRALHVDPATPPTAATSAERVANPPAATQPAAARPAQHAEVKPLAPEQYKVQFTVSRGTYLNLREAQDLLRHRIPNGDIAAVFDQALTLLVWELRKSRHGASARPKATSAGVSHTRHIPAAVKRDVWTRDREQCAFVGAAGRCTERGFLEYHHLVPFADGGETCTDNLELRCRAHNAYEAERWFGVQEEDLLRERGDAWV